MFEVRWIHPLMSVATFSSKEVAELLREDFKRLYSDCYFEVVKL